MYTYTCVDTGPELKMNILNSGYGINFKYEGMLSHSIDEFYIHWSDKFILPTMDNMRISSTTSDMDCSYLNVQLDRIM